MRSYPIRSDPSRLAQLLEVYDENSDGWSNEDLREIFQHQLRTPLLEDLRPAPADVQHLEFAAASQDQQPLKTFGDLLRHTKPPLDLLRLAKDFAKQADNKSDDSLPKKIASALYTLLIAAALVRLDKRITTMNDSDLSQGIKWLMDQSWIEPPMRELAAAALGSV